MSRNVYDIAIVGGGINGCGIARDAAGRGLSVHLSEMDDLGSATSSASTKLIHGGLRYLEYYEFRLVRESLIEREVLWRLAPHLVRPLRFVLPHHKGLRPWWFLRLGLFIYDHLGGRKVLPGTKDLDLRSGPLGEPLGDEFVKGFEYSDCWVDDSRLVVLNAVDAAEKGAVIATQSRCRTARRNGNEWILKIENGRKGESEIRARILVNASGPWVSRFIEESLQRPPPEHVRLVKGSHIVVRRLFGHDQPYIFQNPDGRVIFAIPYERDFTLIGTTDDDFEGDPSGVSIAADEIDRLCGEASRYFTQNVAPNDVVHSFCGVRPLYDESGSRAQAAKRDYVLKVEADGGPPLLNIFGGKITTYRKLAEHTLEKLSPFLPGLKGAWTKDFPLPGGDFPIGGRQALTGRLGKSHPYLDGHHARRLIDAYGTRAERLLEGVSDAAGLGERFGADLFAREVAYLMDGEWALNAADVVWRRSKLGLRMADEEIARLDAWMRGRRPLRRPTTQGGEP